MAEFVDDNKEFKTSRFKKVVQIAVKAMNDVLDEGMPLHPLQEQRDSVRDWRQIGLGIFGLADMLIKMGIRYGSSESIQLCDSIAQTMAIEAINSSSELAYRFGEYPEYNASKVSQSKFWKQHTTIWGRDRIFAEGLRNSQLLTIAPTGSLSTMLGVSGGIEPIYANFYERKTESLHGQDKYYKVYTPIAKDYIEAHGLKDESELPDFFVTAQTLNYKERINMQAVWQDHIDASISSTVNVPNDFTVEKVEDLYLYAWEKGLKGVTIYRDGCKRSGILSTETTDKNRPEEDKFTKQKQEIPRGMIIKADDNCIGKKRTLHTGCGTLHCEAFFDPDTGELLETYFSKGSSGGCNNFMIGLSRMISLSSRAGVDIDSIIDQLKGSGVCPSYAVRTATKRDTSKGSCCPVAIGNALMEMYKEMRYELGIEGEEKSIDSNKTIADSMTGLSTPVDKIKTNKISVSSTCPQCGELLIFEGGCNICKNCGWSKCD